MYTVFSMSLMVYERDIWLPLEATPHTADLLLEMPRGSAPCCSGRDWDSQTDIHPVYNC